MPTPTQNMRKAELKLFLVKPKKGSTWISVLVAAHNGLEARHYHPLGYYWTVNGKGENGRASGWYELGDPFKQLVEGTNWPDLKDLSTRWIGYAKIGTSKGVVNKLHDKAK